MAVGATNGFDFAWYYFIRPMISLLLRLCDTRFTLNFPPMKTTDNFDDNNNDRDDDTNIYMIRLF